MLTGLPSPIAEPSTSCEIVDLASHLAGHGVGGTVGIICRSERAAPSIPDTTGRPSGRLIFAPEGTALPTVWSDWRRITVIPSASDVERAMRLLGSGRRRPNGYCLSVDRRTSLPTLLKHLVLGYDYVLLPWIDPTSDRFTRAVLTVAAQHGSDVIGDGVQGLASCLVALRAGVWMGVLAD